MRYRDFEISVVQGIERRKWKWAVLIGERRISGQASTKRKAMEKAERAIDQALAPAKLKLGFPKQ